MRKVRDDMRKLLVSSIHKSFGAADQFEFRNVKETTMYELGWVKVEMGLGHEDSDDWDRELTGAQRRDEMIKNLREHLEVMLVRSVRACFCAQRVMITLLQPTARLCTRWTRSMTASSRAPVPASATSRTRYFLELIKALLIQVFAHGNVHDFALCVEAHLLQVVLHKFALLRRAE